MENIRELLQSIDKLEDLCIKRGRDKLWATVEEKRDGFYKEMGAFYDEIFYNIDGVTIRFSDRPSTYYDCAGSISISLSIDEMNMSDNIWNNHISHLSKEKEKDIEIKRRKEEILKRKEKQKEFEKLKKELAE